MIVLQDIFIGDYKITQYFGQNPQIYKRFGLKGHNGVDWGTPRGTKLVACFPNDNNFVLSVKKQSSGYGWHIKLWDKKQNVVAIYAHLCKINVKEGDNLKTGQLIGLADNTGFSTGNHLHFSVLKVDKNGYRLNKNNGYLGWLNVLDKRIFKWEVKNLKKPVEGGSMADCLLFNNEKDKKTFETLVAKSSKYDEFKKGGFENIGQVNNLIEQMRDDVDKINGLAKIEQERADELRKKYKELIATLANPDHLDCVQEETEILAQAKKAGANAKELEDLKRAFGAYKEQAVKQESDLKAEIARLKAMLKQKNVLKDAKMEELLREIIRRLINIISFTKQRA